MYFVGLNIGLKILLNSNMLNIIIHLKGTVDSEKKCIAYTVYHLMY